jgi:Cys-tRNA(Pro)/Cys-tRNA(Cys) deacylase
MAKKEPKTNAMRMLERAKIPFEVHRYECKEFIDGITIADMLNEPYERVFKTLVTEGKGGGYFVFVIPIDQELDLKKAAKAAGEKSVEMIHVKDINKITGYIRGGNYEEALKSGTAAGSATAFSEGLASLEMYEKMLKQITE